MVRSELIDHSRRQCSPNEKRTQYDPRDEEGASRARFFRRHQTSGEDPATEARAAIPRGARTRSGKNRSAVVSRPAFEPEGDWPGRLFRRRYPNGRDRTPGFLRIESLHAQPCSSCPASAVTTEVGGSQTLNCVVLICCIRSKSAAEFFVKVEQPFGRRVDQFEAELIGFQRLLAVADRRSARSLAYERGDFMAVMIAMPPRRIAHVNGRRRGHRARASSLCR